MKRVLLLCPTTFGYEKRTREAAIRAGYDVETMDERIGNSVLAKGATRLKLLRLMPWLVRRHVDRIIARLREGQHDTLLILNPETLSRPQVTAIREAVPDVNIVMYAWDAVSRKPNARDCSDIVDAAYSLIRKIVKRGQPCATSRCSTITESRKSQKMPKKSTISAS